METEGLIACPGTLTQIAQMESIGQEGLLGNAQGSACPG